MFLINWLKGSALYYILATMGAVGMGTVGPIAKASGVGSDVITFYRLGFGLLFLLLFLSLSGKIKMQSFKPNFHSIANGAFLAGFIAFYVYAMDYLNMVTAIMTLYSAPILASLIAHFFLNERFNAAQVSTVLFAFLGFVMVFEFRLSFSEDELLGLVLVGIATVCYAAFIIVNRLTDSNVTAYSRSIWQLAAGTLCMLPFAWEGASTIDIDQFGWMVLAGAVPGFMGIVCSVTALEKLSATAFGTLAYMEVVTVAFLGWWLFGESLSLMQFIGCGVIVSAGILQAILSQPDMKKSQRLVPASNG